MRKKYAVIGLIMICVVLLGISVLTLIQFVKFDGERKSLHISLKNYDKRIIQLNQTNSALLISIDNITSDITNTQNKIENIKNQINDLDAQINNYQAKINNLQ